MKTEITATARVVVTLEVPVSGPWGPDCTVAQVHKQAADEALGLISRLRTEYKKNLNIKIVENPRITAVLVERER